MAQLREAVLVDMVRTPFCRSGKEKGAFREFRSDDMGVEVLKAITERNGIDPGDVEDVILGAVEQMGEQAHPGRNCLVLAGFPYEVAGPVVTLGDVAEIVSSDGQQREQLEALRTRLSRAIGEAGRR